MQIRIIGTPKECDEIVRLFVELNMVGSVSRPYKCSSGNYVRVYLNLCLTSSCSDTTVPCYDTTAKKYK